MMTELKAPDLNAPPPKNADDATPAPQESDDFRLMQVSVGDHPLGWLAWSLDSYLEVVEQRVNATAFRFTAPGPDFILPPYSPVGQRGLGISDEQYAQFYLRSDWWSRWILKPSGGATYLQCQSNLQYLGLQSPDNPYVSYLCAWNAYPAVQITLQTR